LANVAEVCQLSLPILMLANNNRYINFGLACFYALMVFAQFNASSPTWGPMGTELNFSDAVLNDTWAIGCATLAVGSVVLIPFALKYGLRSIYILSTGATMLIMVWAAKTKTAGGNITTYPAWYQ
jgi:hypothetical protein